LKSVCEDAWKEASGPLLACCTRFREEVQVVPPYLFRYWQFASNRFYPQRLYKTKYFTLRTSVLGKIRETLHDSNIKSVCLNDTANCPDEEFMVISQELPKLLEQKFPMKSSFES